MQKRRNSFHSNPFHSCQSRKRHIPHFQLRPRPKTPGSTQPSRRCRQNQMPSISAQAPKGPDMADTRYKGQGSRTTGHIADRPAGSEENKRGGRKPFGFASDWQDHAVDATGKQQKRRSHQKRSKRQNTHHQGSTFFRQCDLRPDVFSLRRMRPCVLSSSSVSHGSFTFAASFRMIWSTECISVIGG